MTTTDIEPGEAEGATFAEAADHFLELRDGVLLSLRSCATHPAGPLRAVANLVEAVRSCELGDVMTSVMCDELRDAVAAMDMPDDRRWVIDRFLDALFHGIKP